MSYTAVSTQKEVVILGYQWDELSAQVAAFIAAPVFDDHNHLLGYVIVQLNKQWLTSLVDDRLWLVQTA